MKTNNTAVMTTHELLNIRLDANSVADMLRYLKESDEKAKKTGVYKTHSLISIRDLISICAIKLFGVSHKTALSRHRPAGECRPREVSEEIGFPTAQKLQ